MNTGGGWKTDVTVPDFAAVAALAGEPARAAMLNVLFDGRAMPAGQLAHEAGIAPATASAHLTKLVDAGLLRVRAQGRHRYYELSRPEVAEALETLGSLAPPVVVRSLGESLQMQRLRYARSCYNHLAGEVALSLAGGLVERGALAREEDGFRLSDGAREVFLELGVDVTALFRTPDAHVKACIDWTERRHHIAGPLGQALLASMLERGLVARREEARTLAVTEAGREALRGFGLAT